MLQALFQSAQHLFEKREGSGSVPLTNGSGPPTLVMWIGTGNVLMPIRFRLILCLA